MKNYLFLITIALSLNLCSCEKDKLTEDKTPKFQPIEFVKIGGIDQVISVKGNDLSKPVLLILHGGPGYAMLPLFHMKLSELENHFIIVNWDQRGAGRSYSDDIDVSSMTLNQSISDAHELTIKLKNKFNKDKIYLLGHSWGTVLGIELIKDYPQDYSAYIGVGQVVNVIKNEQHSYAFALNQATTHNNSFGINELVSVGAPNNDGEYLNDKGYEITNKWMEFYGGSIFGQTSSDEVTDLILSDDIYADYKDQWSKGVNFSQQLFDDPNVWSFDFSRTHLDLSLPVYFFMGNHDYDTPFTLVEQYYNTLKAPRKQLVWFENSAHFPFYEERGKFISELIKLSDL
ncbi:alpha/beta fold hydrolase [Ancylomarina euxinus]|nr:alpha/beta hydrolase [Ancylomarina euxinus]MCZ4695579.1 alpha/beta hydrolase [Ancylomarina euxinus]